MSGPPPALEAREVSFRVGRETLVDRVSLRLGAGRLVVVIGPNGAGKSTLLRLLSGEVRPAEGEVRLAGRPIGQVPGWELACRRAVLPQSSRLAFPFTVREVVRIGADGIGRGLRRRDRAALAAAALVRADIAHLADRNYQSLSGGERQRTQFARVLAQLGAGRSVAAEQVLLLDEPTAGLDLSHQLALLDHAASLARSGLAVLAILHDLNLACAYADELVALDRGRVVASGAPAEVVTDRLVREVFRVETGIGVVPGGGRPFLLPPGPAGRNAAAVG